MARLKRFMIRYAAILLTPIPVAADPSCHNSDMAAPGVSIPFPKAYGKITSLATHEPLFCRDPYLALCNGDGPTQERPAQVRRDTLDRLRKQVYFRARQNLAEKYGLSANEALSRFPDPIDANKARGGDAQEMAEEVYKENLNLIKAKEMSDVKGTKERVREALISSIKADLGNDLTESERASLVSKVRSIRFELPSEAFRTALATDPKRALSYSEVCGDGFSDNAYYQEDHAGGHPAIVICPGFLLSTSSETSNSMIWVIAHEIGHSIDPARSSALRKVYSKYQECILWKSEHELEAGDERFYPGSANPRYKVHYHRNEIAADYWALRVIESQMEQKAGAWKPEAALSHLRSTYQMACNPGDEGAHPGGKFRVGRMLGESSYLRKIMGCRSTERLEQDRCGVGSRRK